MSCHHPRLRTPSRLNCRKSLPRPGITADHSKWGYLELPVFRNPPRGLSSSSSGNIERAPAEEVSCARGTLQDFLLICTCVVRRWCSTSMQPMSKGRRGWKASCWRAGDRSVQRDWTGRTRDWRCKVWYSASLAPCLCEHYYTEIYDCCCPRIFLCSEVMRVGHENGRVYADLQQQG